MPMVKSRLKADLDSGFFGQPSNSKWDKAISNAVVQAVRDDGSCDVVASGSAKPGGMATIDGLTNVNQAVFLAKFPANYKKCTKLPGTPLSDTIGMQTISKIGDELGEMQITAGPYPSVGEGSCTVSGITVDPDVITKYITDELKGIDPVTDTFKDRDKSGAPQEGLVGPQSGVAKAIALTCEEVLSTAAGTGTVSGPSAPPAGGSGTLPGTIE